MKSEIAKQINRIKAVEVAVTELHKRPNQEAENTMQTENIPDRLSKI